MEGGEGAEVINNTQVGEGNSLQQQATGANLNKGGAHHMIKAGVNLNQVGSNLINGTNLHNSLVDNLEASEEVSKTKLC